jgi:hypothetical protein
LGNELESKIVVITNEVNEVMKLSTRMYLLSLAAVGLMFFQGSFATVGAQTRIYFARGATRATVRGSLQGIRDEANYILKAKAGQHMRVEIKGRGPTRGSVTFPSGRGDGGPGGVVFDGILPETGDYGIRVTESSMANGWRGGFTLIIDIVAEGSSSSDQDLSRYVGRYPNDLFRGVPGLRTRLRTLLGTSYKSFFDRMQTEAPIDKDGRVLIVRACMAHSCGIDEAILAINLDSDTLHVAIKTNSRYRTWSERGSIPAALNRAMRE